jgi:plasmid maintenance system antidote protein VapI
MWMTTPATPGEFIREVFLVSMGLWPYRRAREPGAPA